MCDKIGTQQMQMSEPKQSSNSHSLFELAIQVFMKFLSFACKNISDSFALPQKSYSCLTATIPGSIPGLFFFFCLQKYFRFNCSAATILFLSYSLNILSGFNQGREYDRNRYSLNRPSRSSQCKYEIQFNCYLHANSC